METDHLIDLIYDSVADASRWSAFLDGFSKAVRTPRCALLIHDTERLEFGVVRWHGWSDDDIRIYEDNYGAIDPLGVGAQRLGIGEVGPDTLACPREEFEASIAFREFYQPRDCIHGMGGAILVTPSGRSVISAFRGAADGPFGETELSALRSLMPHLKRAALLHGEIGSLRRQISTFTGHLERYPYAFLLTDAERRVLYSNAAARNIAASADGLKIQDGRLAAISPRLEELLRKAVADIAAGRGASLQRLEIPRPSRRQSYRVILMPVQDSRTIALGVAVPGVSILVIDTASLSEPDPDVLRELFSLTPAEARVSTDLVLGKSAEQIAAESNTSIETVRTHIKRTLSKTATARQGELISLILRSVPFRRA